MNINQLPITLDQVRNIAPSVFAERPADYVSPAYNFVQTSKILELMMEAGWKIIHAKQQKVRDVSKKDHTKHTILLRNPQFEGVRTLGGLIPTIKMFNSHNWASTFGMNAGMMRLVCGNGLLVSGPEYANFNIRHDKVMEDIMIILETFRTYVEKMFERANRWNSIQVAPAMIDEFASRAAVIRFGESATKDHANALIQVQRIEDDSPTLWNIFNTVQENAIKGGNKTGDMKRRIRSVTNIDADREINTKLWELADEYARIVD